MNATDECIEVCQKLLRGELSAVETYTHAIGKCDSDIEKSALEVIRFEHENSANRLRDHLREMGAEPTNDSGLWGSFANLMEAAANVLGSSPALAVLEQGEEHGIDEYEEALRNPAVMEEMKAVIRDSLLPPLSQHIVALQQLRKD